MTVALSETHKQALMPQKDMQAREPESEARTYQVRVDEVYAFGRLVSYRLIDVRKPTLTDAQIDHIWNNR
jgi:hypothetical protein